MAPITRRAAVAAVILAACAGAAFASGLDEARALFAEGKELLKKGRGPTADVVKWNKKAIAKFEEAVAKLEGARDGSREAELQQDINALLFWTKRTTPMDMSAILGGSSGPPATSSPPPAPRPSPGPAAKTDAGAAMKALALAEVYARRHPNDPMACTARFFQVADRYKDFPDVAFKAISRAQEFQRLAKERRELAQAEARFGTLTPGEKLTVEGDRACAARRLDEAAEKYRRAISIKATPERYRKLGHACFVRAQELRSEYSRKYVPPLQDYWRARKRKDMAGVQAAIGRMNALKPLGRRAVATYVESSEAFESALKSSPDRMDIDSELHVALTLRIRKEKHNRMRAQSIFEKILHKYHDKLRTDEERTLYAYAETFAGPAAVARVRRQIARRVASVGSGPGGGSEALTDPNAEAAEKLPREMSTPELRRAVSKLTISLRKDEVKLKNSQLSGRFDKPLLDKVNAERKQLKELEAEASRRGVR